MESHRTFRGRSCRYPALGVVGCSSSPRRPSPWNEAIGCYFIYRIELDGSGPNGQFVLRALGAASPALGLEYVVRSDGENRGIPQKVARHE